jgi:hypothetical protein
VKHWHLSLNTLITVLIFIVITVYAIRQEVLIAVFNDIDTKFKVYQAGQGESKRIAYNAMVDVSTLNKRLDYLESVVPTPTMGYITISKEAVK